MNSALRALNGFGLGARPGERRRVTDPRGWLRAQLSGGPPPLPPPPEATPAAIADAIRAFRAAGQGNDQERRDARQQARRKLVAIAAAESRAALTARVSTERAFVERLVAFWSNHLCVAIGAKSSSRRWRAATARRDSAARARTLRRHGAGVRQTSRDAVYLDNLQSIGPTRRGAHAPRHGPGQQRGLKRELCSGATRAPHAGRQRRVYTGRTCRSWQRF